ncbi:eukaryotic translation initiation factor 3subunit B [Striga asiatica]|uniref:Eukaryotic translation initiation factor 3subunit B n=1 Tax=Striga asiatica TaxID=4170 RepID=A0A5A7RHG6_STRAF|nr:eukaryotic translation initiation factor 3subunit B [Striga asiatica]
MADLRNLRCSNKVGVRLSDNGINKLKKDLKDEQSLESEEGFETIILVQNLPVVSKEKFEKLEGGWALDACRPDTQKTLGYCFLEFDTPQEAELAREKTNGYKLDRSHIFVVNMLDGIEKFMKFS